MESWDLRVVNCFQMSEIEAFNFLKGYIRNEKWVAECSPRTGTLLGQ